MCTIATELRTTKDFVPLQPDNLRPWACHWFVYNKWQLAASAHQHKAHWPMRFIVVLKKLKSLAWRTWEVDEVMLGCFVKQQHMLQSNLSNCNSNRSTAISTTVPPHRHSLQGLAAFLDQHVLTHCEPGQLTCIWPACIVWLKDWLEYQKELFGGGDLVEAAQDNNSNAFTACL